MSSLPLKNITSSLNRLSVAMYTSAPEKTRGFYETLGIRFAPEGTHLQSSAHIPTLKILSSSCANTGIHLELQEAKKINTLAGQMFTDHDQRTVAFTTSPSQDNSLLKSDRWVTLLRTKQMEETKQFYQFLGEWQPEKHGNGPDHYSLELKGSLFEIYPLRKKHEGNVEFVVQIDALSECLQKLESQGFAPLETRETSVLFRDPDSRLVQLLRTSH